MANRPVCLTRRQALTAALALPTLACREGPLRIDQEVPLPDDRGPREPTPPTPNGPAHDVATPSLPRDASASFTSPGLVVDVVHASATVGDLMAPVREMMVEAMRSLTGGASLAASFRAFFSPDDVVAIKVNPFGYPKFFTQVATVSAIVDGLMGAGVDPKNIVIYDRYAVYLDQVDYLTALPAGVRAVGLSAIDQTSLDGYDPDAYLDLPYVDVGLDASVAVHRRSHVAKLISRDVTKVINVPVIKSHWTAGVTAALKNMTYGLVNNTARTHTADTITTTEFIPAILALPAIRDKVVLHIVDALVGCYDGGPEPSNSTFTRGGLLVGTDPVALDRIAWSIVDEERAKKGLLPVGAEGALPANAPHYIERAGALGFGVADEGSIERRILRLV